MSTALAKRLPDAAAEINEQIRLTEDCLRNAVTHAWEAGRRLGEVKAHLAHGAWLAWLAENVNLSARRSQEWIDLAGSYARAPAHMTIEEALRDARRERKAPDLRSALRTVDRADAQAALDELGPIRQVERFPAPGMEQTTFRQVGEALARAERAMQEACADDLSKWSRAEALHEAARHARNAGSQLSALAQTLAA